MTTQREIIYTTSPVNLYSLKEKTQSSPHHRRCIDGRITGSGKCVGYCEYEGHPGYLTKELRKHHDCINKSCHHYYPKEKKVEVPEYKPFAALQAFIA